MIWMNQLKVTTREDWRRWLQENHAASKEVWLVFHTWISSAKKSETRLRRTREAIRKLERGERLGLK